MKRLAAFLGLVVLLSQSAIETSAALALTSQQELRARALQKELRCVVCQGQSLDESNAPLAADIRALIRSQIAAGQSDSMVKRYLVDRYGDFILLKPPLDPNTYLLWLGPGIVLLLGGLTVITVIARARRKTAQLPLTGSPTRDITDS